MTAIPAPPPEPDSQRFLASFFDASFRNFVTPALVAVAWFIWIGVVGLGVALGILVGFADGEPEMAVLAPLIGVGVLIIVRILLEATMVFFSMAKDLKTLANAATNRPGGPHLPA